MRPSIVRVTLCGFQLYRHLRVELNSNVNKKNCLEN